MAHLRGPLGWLVGALVTCGALGLAYLPPRGASRDARTTLSGVMTGAPTAERQRANALAKEWRLAALEVRLREWRHQLAPELERLRATGQPTFVTSIDSAWPRELRERAARAVAAAWQALELGTTKIGVAIIMEPERVMAAVPERTPAAHLLPDSLDRHTCVAWVEPSGSQRALLERSDEQYAQALMGWMRRVLGPCAFYARYGRPSQRIERWLGNRQHGFDLVAAWDSPTIQYEHPWLARLGTASERAAWVGWARQQYPAIVLGCLAERTGACRDAVVGTVPSSGPVRALVARAADAGTHLPASSLLLTEMVREFGPARFGRFWTSGLEPDSAFRLAMDTTLGDWVMSRQRAYGTTLVAGPAPSVLAGAFGLSVALLGFAFAAAAAMRRQVG